MFTYHIEKLSLKKTWKLSRNSSDIKENFILKLNDCLSEIAPNIRYGETLELVSEELEIAKSFFEQASDLDHINSQLEEFQKKYKISNSTRFGLESLLIHDLVKRLNISIYDLFNLAIPLSRATSYSLPIMESNELSEYLALNEQFDFYKIKVNEENAISVVKEIQSLTSNKLRIDANEGFTSCDSVLSFLNEVNCKNIEFLEQPLPAHLVSEQLKLYQLSPIPLMADESILDKDNLEELSKMFHMVNIKLMKAGGYIKAIKQLNKARLLGMKTMIGCMIETSVGISCAMRLNTLADFVDLDGSLLLKNDPFSYIKEEAGILSIL
jgi:L-alanine-DL-glutamate epimerase-like enolase superfamily enzyme